MTDRQVYQQSWDALDAERGEDWEQFLLQQANTRAPQLEIYKNRRKVFAEIENYLKVANELNPNSPHNTYVDCVKMSTNLSVALAVAGVIEQSGMIDFPLMDYQLFVGCGGILLAQIAAAIAEGHGKGSLRKLFTYLNELGIDGFLPEDLDKRYQEQKNT